jgi:hypothetical protein
MARKRCTPAQTVRATPEAEVKPVRGRSVREVGESLTWGREYGGLSNRRTSLIALFLSRATGECRKGATPRQRPIIVAGPATRCPAWIYDHPVPWRTDSGPGLAGKRYRETY